MVEREGKRANLRRALYQWHNVDLLITRVGSVQARSLDPSVINDAYSPARKFDSDAGNSKRVLAIGWFYDASIGTTLLTGSLDTAWVAVENSPRKTTLLWLIGKNCLG